MKAELKSLFSLNVKDVENFVPLDEDDFGISMRMVFGGDQGSGEDSFDVMVCSPKWISRRVRELGIFDPRHHILMRNFDFTELKLFVLDYARRCDGENWSEIAAKLSRLGHWEFEDYRP